MGISQGTLEFCSAQELDRFYRFLIPMFDSFDWELAQTDRLPSVREFLEHRDHLIAVYPWLELWRLDMGA